jgi:hypothetical protein
MSVAGVELAGQASVQAGASLVHAGQLGGLAVAGVVDHDPVEGGDRGGVPDVRVGQVDDDPRRVAEVVEVVGQVAA